MAHSCNPCNSYPPPIRRLEKEWKHSLGTLHPRSVLPVARAQSSATCVEATVMVSGRVFTMESSQKPLATTRRQDPPPPRRGLLTNRWVVVARGYRNQKKTNLSRSGRPGLRVDPSRLDQPTTATCKDSGKTEHIRGRRGQPHMGFPGFLFGPGPNHTA